MFKPFSPILFRDPYYPKPRRMTSLCCTFHHSDQKLPAHGKISKARTEISESTFLSFLLKYSALASQDHLSFSPEKNNMIQNWKIEASLTVTLFPLHFLNNNLCNRYFHCYISTVTHLYYVLEMVQHVYISPAFLRSWGFVGERVAPQQMIVFS